MTMRLTWPHLPTITPWHIESLGYLMTRMSPTAVPASIAVVQNTRYYYQFDINYIVTINKVFAMIGATQNGNIDIAIHDTQLNLIQASGSTAMGAANTLQVIDWTDLVLLPGTYFMSIATDSATGTFFSINVVDDLALPLAQLWTQATAFTAPDPAIPVVSTSTNPNVLLFGLLIDDTVLS